MVYLLEGNWCRINKDRAQRRAEDLEYLIF